ncbi:alcohol dehydrogenase catalytic domain-containing protein [Streptomyces canus]|uniref:zinc-dependent alcohol dehydrogenase n=1 Tax=Streptomyces canus TaxID=58343 RepID=UPI0033D41283
MKISQVIGPRTSEVVEIPDPIPREDEVLVEVVSSGVCASDLGPWLGHSPSAAPLRLGHEMVGRVVAVGSKARWWVPGDLVTGLGGHGFATLAVMDADAVLPVPPGVEPAHALGEPVACLEEALSRTGMRAGDRVAVVGLGFMGLSLVQLVRRHLPGLLVGVDPTPTRRDRALALGCDLAFAPGQIPERYRTATGRESEARLDLVIEATGVTPGLTTAGSLVRPFGTLCVVGYHHSGDALMDLELWYKAVTVVNGFCPDRTRTMAAMREALGLVAQRRFHYEPLITHHFGLEQVDEAFAAMLEAGDDFVKAVVVP